MYVINTIHKIYTEIYKYVQCHLCIIYSAIFQVQSILTKTTLRITMQSIFICERIYYTSMQLQDLHDWMCNGLSSSFITESKLWPQADTTISSHGSSFRSPAFCSSTVPPKPCSGTPKVQMRIEWAVWKPCSMLIDGEGLLLDQHGGNLMLLWS